MGRAEERKMRKKVDKKIGKGRVQEIAKDLNAELINYEVNRKCNVFQNMLIDSVVEAMKRNGLSDSKIKRISDDIELVLRKKVHGVE